MSRDWKGLVEAVAAACGLMLFAGFVFLLFGLAASRAYELIVS